MGPTHAGTRRVVDPTARPPTVVARALLVLLGCAAILASLTVPALLAHADDPGPEDGAAAKVAITLTSLTPDRPTRDDTITITGTVRNITHRPLSELEVFFWRSLEPITDAEAVAAALESAPTQPLGRRMDDSPVSLSTTELAPRATATFTVSAAVRDLQLPSIDGAYLMGVHVRTHHTDTIGRARTFVPITDTHDQPVPGGANHHASVSVTSIVLLSSAPAMLRPAIGTSPATFVDEHLVSELRPRGRLSRLLASAERADVSHAVDPSLIEELQAMARGYRVQVGTRFTPGTGKDLASDWLTRFADLQTNNDGYRLPFAVPDLAALAHQAPPGDDLMSPTRLLKQTKQAAARVSATKQLPLLVMPAQGLADPATVKLAGQLSPAALLLSSTSASGPQPLLHSAGTAPIVSYAAGSFDGGPGPDPRTSPVQLRQRLLADSLIQSMAGAAAPSTVRVISSAAQAQADSAADAPWTQRRDLTRLLRSRPASWAGPPVYPAAAAAAELTPDQLTSIADLGRSFQGYRELMANPAAIDARADAAMARAISSWWRSTDLDPDRLIAPQIKEVSQIFDGKSVRLHAQKRILMTGSEGSSSVNVTNDLASDVRVSIEFSSGNSQRLSIPDQHNILVRAGENASVLIHPEAKSNGPVLVKAQLTTACNSEAPGTCTRTRLGKPVTMEVVATHYGTVGWLIAVAAGIVLAIATAVRIRQVHRERRPDESAVDAAKVEAQDSATQHGLAAQDRAPRKEGHE